MQVVGEAVDVILLGWELPGIAGRDLLCLSRLLLPSAAVVALSGRPESREEAQEAGVNAFVSKCAPSAALLTVLKAQPAAGYHVA